MNYHRQITPIRNIQLQSKNLRLHVTVDIGSIVKAHLADCNYRGDGEILQRLRHIDPADRPRVHTRTERHSDRRHRILAYRLRVDICRTVVVRFMGMNVDKSVLHRNFV